MFIFEMQAEASVCVRSKEIRHFEIELFLWDVQLENFQQYKME
jgi:hypothetical protein